MNEVSEVVALVVGLIIGIYLGHSFSSTRYFGILCDLNIRLVKDIAEKGNKGDWCEGVWHSIFCMEECFRRCDK